MADTDAEDPEETDDMREFRHRYEDRRFFRNALDNDVSRSEAMLHNAPDDPFARRTLVRAIFAQIEGLCAEAIDWAKYYASDDSVHHERYTPAERAVLRGESARVNDRGEAIIEPSKYIPTKPNLRFALSLVGRGAEELAPIVYGDAGWDALNSGFSVRDRLMHPKRPEDVEVSDTDLGQVQSGRAWFLKTIRLQEAALQKTLGKRLSSLLREQRRSESAT